MNYRQRAYDSYDRGTYNLKITNSYYHFKNIQKILFTLLTLLLIYFTKYCSESPNIKQSKILLTVQN